MSIDTNDDVHGGKEGINFHSSNVQPQLLPCSGIENIHVVGPEITQFSLELINTDDGVEIILTYEGERIVSHLDLTNKKRKHRKNKTATI